jgi:hypothetical protein
MGQKAYYLLELEPLKRVFDVQSGIVFSDYGGDSVILPFVWLIGLGIAFRLCALGMYVVPAIKIRILRCRRRHSSAKQSYWTLKRVRNVTIIATVLCVAALVTMAIVAGIFSDFETNEE